MSKPALRAQMKKLAMQVSPSDKERVSKLLCNHLIRYVDDHVQAGTLIGLFKSMKDEVELSYLEAALLVRGFNLWFPVDRHCERSEAIQMLLIVPGLAFDRSGHRLGRGGGYYDRLISLMRERGTQFTSIGVGFDHQLIDAVPKEKHDQHLDFLCMPHTGLIQCK